MIQPLRTFTMVCLVGSLLAITACNNPSVDPDKPGSSGTDGYLVGKVVDPQGQPLPKATIYIDHTLLTGNGPEVKTAADGSYKMQMINLAGQWVAKGYILKQYNNRVYKIALDPENEESFTSTEKPVRNFQWKLTGHIPDLSLDLYYGGTIEMFRDPNVTDFNDNENIEFTLTPVGPLIDGSTGKVLKLRSKKRYDTFLRDVPMGRYTITATYKPTGEQLLVCDAWGDEFTYQPSVTLDFLGTEATYRANNMGVAYTRR